jgi:hypothetical protein
VFPLFQIIGFIIFLFMELILFNTTFFFFGHVVYLYVPSFWKFCYFYFSKFASLIWFFHYLLFSSWDLFRERSYFDFFFPFSLAYIQQSLIFVPIFPIVCSLRINILHFLCGLAIYSAMLMFCSPSCPNFLFLESKILFFGFLSE